MQRTEFKMQNKNYVTPKLGFISSIFRAPPPTVPTVVQTQMNWQANNLQENKVSLPNQPSENKFGFFYNRV